MLKEIFQHSSLRELLMQEVGEEKLKEGIEQGIHLGELKALRDMVLISARRPHLRRQCRASLPREVCNERNQCECNASTSSTASTWRTRLCLSFSRAADHPLTCEEIATVLGKSANYTGVYLHRLKHRCLVCEDQGRWSLAASPHTVAS